MGAAITTILLLLTTISSRFPDTEQGVWHIVGAQQMLARYKLNASLHILEP